LDGIPATTGRDVTQAHEPTQALLMARSRGALTASATYVLLQDRSLPVSAQQLSFVLTAPVYGGAGTPDAGRFRAWILMELRGNDFLGETLVQASQRTVAVTLLDSATARTPTEPVARTGNHALAGHEHLRRTVPITIAGRTWQLVVAPTAGMSAAMDPWLTLLCGGAGVLFTLLITALVGVLSTSRNHAMLQVERATAALREDIGRREAVEAQLRERESELQAFAGIVAHDLKSPLTHLMGYSDILAEDHAADLGDIANGYLSRITLNARRMWALIDDLLRYTEARDSHLKTQPVDLDALARDVIANRSESRADQRPHIETGPLPTLVGDPVLLHQVFDNLIGNAIKYVRPGAIPYISISAIRAGPHHWCIEIADRGIGIDEADEGAVFATFHRAPGSEGYPGTGLGLAICHRIIERHHGQIGVNANPGGGSRFWFTLPTEQPTEHPIVPAASTPATDSRQDLPHPAPVVLR
jgi:signal transduction histidine kinase